MAADPVEYQRDYYERNKERVLARQAAAYADPEKRAAKLERQKQRYHEKRDEICAQRRNNHDKERSRWQGIKYTYGLTKDDWMEMFERQNGRCDICRVQEHDAPRGTFYVDHCHATGRVRALLCHNCNMAIGQMSERSDLMIAAADWLKRQHAPMVARSATLLLGGRDEP